MSALAVRPTREDDLPRISDLTERVFGVRRDPDLLRWLLRNPHAPDQIDSWVADRDGEILGHVAILKSGYLARGRRLTGAHAFLWMVEADSRGDAGLCLGRTIVRYDDFLIVLGGSPATKTILSGRRFSQAEEAREYLFRRPAPAEDDGFDLSDGNGAADEAVPAPPTVCVNEATSEHLDWLAECPELEAHRFALAAGGRSLGPVLVYVNRRTSPACGRLVHLPYLGDEPERWTSALGRIGREFERLQSPSWSVLATHPALVEACEATGADLVGRRPVWFRKRRDVPGTEAWHLTYLEGDLAYRRVERR